VPTRELRNLAPPIAASEEGRRRLIAAGAELAHKCTFCGGPTDAAVGCPELLGLADERVAIEQDRGALARRLRINGLTPPRSTFCFAAAGSN
jgi:hypothetical protein